MNTPLAAHLNLPAALSPQFEMEKEHMYVLFLCYCSW